MATTSQQVQSTREDSPEPASKMQFDRRSILRSTVALGAGGLALLSRPSDARASGVCGFPPAEALLSPLGCGAAGDGLTDDTQELKDTINAAIALMAASSGFDYVEPTIDLQGRTYKFTSTLNIHPPISRLTPKARLRIINGTLLSSVGPGTSITPVPAIHIKRTSGAGDYPEITFENVRIQKLQFPHVIGLWVEGGLRCSFINCAVEPRNIYDPSSGSPKQTAFGIGVLLHGAQICNFIDCHFAGNTHHVVFERGAANTASTDCRFYGCSFSESSGSAIQALDGGGGTASYPAAQCLFHGCSIETARSGSLVQFESVRNAKFHCCRFEDTAVSLVALSNCSDTRFFDCNFSGSSGNPCIDQCALTAGTTLVGNVFPTPGTAAAMGSSAGAYRSVANTYLLDC